MGFQFEDLRYDSCYVLRSNNPKHVPLPLPASMLKEEFIDMLDKCDQDGVLDERTTKWGSSGQYLEELRDDGMRWRRTSKIHLTKEWLLEFHRLHTNLQSS